MKISKFKIIIIKERIEMSRELRTLRQLKCKERHQGRIDWLNRQLVLSYRLL
jgi:hypothetical protein